MEAGRLFRRCRNFSMLTFRRVNAQVEEVDAGREEMEAGRLFCRNLSYMLTAEELEEVFAPFGELKEVHLVKDRKTNTSKGFAYVLFEDPADAERALAALDRSTVQASPTKTK
eukprot:9466642-Pyramimonas_sp.AAC.1